MLFVFFVMAGFSMQEGISEKDASYYMLDSAEVSEEDITPKPQPQSAFKVYWNVPTIQCKSKNVPFDDLSRFGIIQNEADKFRQGDKMTILYDPGFFPAMFFSSPKVYRYRNGGVPQEGSIQKHLDALKISVEEAIPNKEYNGIAVIHFESWKPIFLQNYGNLKPYIDVSYDIERKEHWWWPESWIITTARERFERAARIFMESTLKFGKKMRPNATWGYYSYPYCYNKAIDYKCARKTIEENDGDAVAQEMASFYDETWYEYGTNLAVDTRGEVDSLEWLWNESTGIFPSVSANFADAPTQLKQRARATIAEAVRVSHGAAVLPYLSYSYKDSSYYTKSVMEVLLDTIYNSKASGVIIWGKSKDVNTQQKCRQLLDYMTKKIGPIIAQFTRGERRRAETTTTTPLIETTTQTKLIETSTQTKLIETSTQTKLIETSTETKDNTIPTEKITVVKPTEVLPEAFSEPSHQFITTQIMENVSDFLETANRAKQDSLSGEIVLNSIIQFFDMADSSSTFNETNSDETPDSTQNEIEQELKPETNTLTYKSDDSLSIKRKEIPIPKKYLPMPILNIVWKKLNVSTPEGNTTIKQVIETTTELYKTKAFTIRKTMSTQTNINDEITTEVTTVKELSSTLINTTENERDSKEILETLSKLSSRLNESNSELSATNKNVNDDEELANASQILQDLAEDGHNESNDHRLKSVLNNNPSTDFKHFYDFESIEDTLDSPQDSKPSIKHGQEAFEDDIILEAVAQILNPTDGSDITYSL